MLNASGEDKNILKLKLNIAVEPGHAVSEYARNVVALGEMEQKRAELFEPKASFRLSRNELRATVAGHSERWDAPVQLPPF